MPAPADPLLVLRYRQIKLKAGEKKEIEREVGILISWSFRDDL